MHMFLLYRNRTFSFPYFFMLLLFHHNVCFLKWKRAHSLLHNASKFYISCFLSLIPMLKERQEYEFEANLVFRASCRTACATQRKTQPQKNRQKNFEALKVEFIFLNEKTKQITHKDGKR